MSVFDVNKIQVCGDVIVYDGDQIAEIVAPGCVELSMTHEDLKNGEVPLSKRREIVSNKNTIKQEICRLGYKVVK
jgi:hypothetical protein